MGGSAAPEGRAGNSRLPAKNILAKVYTPQVAIPALETGERKGKGKGRTGSQERQCLAVFDPKLGLRWRAVLAPRDVRALSLLSELQTLRSAKLSRAESGVGAGVDAPVLGALSTRWLRLNNLSHTASFCVSLSFCMADGRARSALC